MNRSFERVLSGKQVPWPPGEGLLQGPVSGGMGVGVDMVADLHVVEVTIKGCQAGPNEERLAREGCCCPCCCGDGDGLAWATDITRGVFSGVLGLYNVRQLLSQSTHGFVSFHSRRDCVADWSFLVVHFPVCICYVGCGRVEPRAADSYEYAYCLIISFTNAYSGAKIFLTTVAFLRE